MGLGRFMASMSHRSRRYELELKLNEKAAVRRPMPWQRLAALAGFE
jgi:hypothetical protein